jgi:hypothetical protein
MEEGSRGLRRGVDGVLLSWGARRVHHHHDSGRKMPDHRDYDTMRREEQELTPVLGTLSTLVSLYHSRSDRRKNVPMVITPGTMSGRDKGLEFFLIISMGTVT